MACLQPPRNTRKPFPENSAFFPNANNRQEQKNGAGNPRDTNVGVVIQPFHFPPTKQIWWDRKPQGSSEVLHITSRRNLRLLVNEKTIRLAIKHLNQSSSPYECFLIGSISIDSREEAVEINVDRFDPGRDMVDKKGGVKRKVPTTVVPGDQIVPLTLIKGLSGAENSTTHSKKEFQRTLEVLDSRISGQDALNLSNFLSLKATCYAHVDDDEIILNLHFGAVSIVTSIVATPVRPVPIIPTALARNLTGPLRISDVEGTPKCGFLTMDHTRKLLLLLESDPKAYSLPLIGVWISGPFTIHHPYIWSCCVRFLQCNAIQERVLASPNTFLLVHYSPAQTNPIFWECSPQDQLEEGLFELYSSYDNLHLDQISSAKYTEPLCFELVPPGDTLNRAMFSQAVSSWTKERQSHSSKNPSGLERKVIVERNSGSLEPRPSPSPHPQMTQSPILMPSVPEVSLSLSFEESIFSDENQNLVQENQNGKFLPNEKKPVLAIKDGTRILPPKKDNQAILRRNTQIQDQENRGDPRYAGKQALIQRTPMGTPQREPLRPVTGQLNYAQTPPDPRHGNDMLGPQGHVVPNRRRCMQNRAVDGARDGKGPPKKVQKDMAMIGRGRGPSVIKRANGRTVVGAQGKSVMTRQVSCEESRVPLIVVEDPNYRDNNTKAHENARGEHGKDMERDGMVTAQKSYGYNMNAGEEQQHSSNHNTMPVVNTVIDVDHTRMHRQVEPRQENHQQHQPNDDGIIYNQQESGIKQIKPFLMPTLQDNRLFNQHQANGAAINSSHHESGMDKSVFCDSGVGDSTRNTTEPEEDHEGSFEGTFHKPTRKEERNASSDRPDPYDMIMRQEQQLKELQQQINLLLLQQSLTQNSPVGIPTPPPTPVSSHSLLLSSPVRTRDMVTMGTNTGTSLLMGSPVRRGKASVGTSPLRETGKQEEKRLRSQRSSSSTTGNPTATSMTQSPNQHLPDGTFHRESTPQSRQSQDGTTDDDELDEKDLVIERLDDTNLTLASSIQGVDICEFVGSPESTRGQRRSRDSSPILGESASMMMMQQQQQEPHHSQGRGTETPDDDRRFESLLYKNERLFYDNLLSKVNQLLCEKVGKSEGTPETSHDATQNDQPEKKNEDDLIHEPTRQEVFMATVKELQRIKEISGTDPIREKVATPKPSQRYNDDIVRSSFAAVFVPDHPRINYMSMSVDETIDETALDTESLALKYFDQEQLHEYRQLLSNYHGNRGRGSTRAPSNIGNGSFVNEVDCTWNNLSMATQDYLQRYNLGGPKRETKCTGNGNDHVSGTQAPEESRDESMSTILCVAPPPTPEARHTESRILDIQRLRNLPKLL